MAPTRLWFLRHGETGGGTAGAFIGRSEADLSVRGRHQAEAMKEYLRDAEVHAIVSSPARRARATAAPLAAHHGLPVRPVAGFAEMDFGRWEGLHWPDIERLDPDYARRWQADPCGLPCPGGEPCDAFQARVTGALRALLEEFRGRSVVLSGHAGTGRAILAHVLGLRYIDAFAFAQDYGCLNAAAWGEGGTAQIALVNFVPGPRSAAAEEPGPGAAGR